jgi:hypothetical protein
MSDYVSSLERELRAAARRLEAASRGGRRRRRGALVAAVAAAAVAAPGVAAVTGAWDDSPPEPAPEAGVVAEPGEPLSGGSGGSPSPSAAPGEDGVVVHPGACTSAAPARPPDSSEPVDADLLRTLAGLRRARTADDRLAAERVPPTLAGVHRDAIRLATRTPDGGRLFLVPARDVRYSPQPDAESGCPREPPREPEPGVCLVPVGTGAGSVCATAGEIRSGAAVVRGDRVPGDRPGTAHVAGIVPDGVEAVTLRYPAGNPVREVTALVVNNVFAVRVNASAAVEPRVVWHTADGARDASPGG